MYKNLVPYSSLTTSALRKLLGEGGCKKIKKQLMEDCVMLVWRSLCNTTNWKVRNKAIIWGRTFFFTHYEKWEKYIWRLSVDPLLSPSAQWPLFRPTLATVARHGRPVKLSEQGKRNRASASPTADILKVKREVFYFSLFRSQKHKRRDVKFGLNSVEDVTHSWIQWSSTKTPICAPW